MSTYSNAQDVAISSYDSCASSAITGIRFTLPHWDLCAFGAITGICFTLPHWDLYAFGAITGIVLVLQRPDICSSVNAYFTRLKLIKQPSRMIWRSSAVISPSLRVKGVKVPSFTT